MTDLIFETIGWAIIAGLAVGVFLAVVMLILSVAAWLLGWRDG